WTLGPATYRSIAMQHRTFFVWLVIVSATLIVGTPAPAAGKKKSAEKSDAAAATVEKVLRSEVAEPVDRRAQLADALKQQPDSAAARWQAGFVKDGGSWRSFDEASRNSSTAGAHEDYRRRREESPNTFADQLDLANWCRKQGLKDQERAHLHAALRTS